MFDKEKDFNFIAYNNLLLLDYFECNSENKKWQDYRKLIYLYPYVTDTTLLALLQRATNPELRKFINTDIVLLRETYTKSYLLSSLVKSVLLNMEKNEMISFSKNDTRHTIDLWINLEKCSKGLLSSTIFELEQGNLEIIKSIFPRLRGMTLKTILQRIYKDNGVDIWEV